MTTFQNNFYVKRKKGSLSEFALKFQKLTSNLQGKTLYDLGPDQSFLADFQEFNFFLMAFMQLVTKQADIFGTLIRHKK